MGSSELHMHSSDGLYGVIVKSKNSFIKEFPDKTQTGFKRITHRSTDRQKQECFLPIGKLLVKERYHPKEDPFSLVSLIVIRCNFIQSFFCCINS